MKLYLGVDGGGTKTKFILCEEHGKLLAQSIQPTCHYLQCGLAGVTKVMKDGVAECLHHADCQQEQISAAFIACAGYGDIAKDDPLIEEAVKQASFSFPYRIGNDMENALAGSLGGCAGINIIAGTGSIALGKNEQGEQLRCGGWHHSFGGDEGSAFWIACQLIRHFTRQSDGREAKTALYDMLKETYEFKEDSDILDQCVVEWNFDRTKIAAMSRLITPLAQQHDPIAIQILKDAAQELADIILAIARKLPFETTRIPVSYSGGVFQSGEYLLNPLKQALAQDPHLHLQAPLLTPDAGCIILAMQQDHCSITQEILTNLKEK